MEDNRVLLLEQEFHNFKEQVESEIADLKKTNRYLDNRLKEMEMSKQKTEYQYEQIIETLKTLNEKTIPNLTAQIEELKNKPVKRYDQAVSGLLGAIFGSIGTFIASLFINK